MNGSKAYLQPHFDAGTSRWQWSIVVNDHTKTTQVARSVQTYPTERDAMDVGRAVRLVFLAGDGK